MFNFTTFFSKIDINSTNHWWESKRSHNNIKQ